MTKIKPFIPLLVIFALSLLVRLYGLNWDQGQHLHPDERFLTMYINDLPLPTGILNYLSSNSPLNPYNHNQYRFFVYGTFPTTLISLTSYILNLKSYININLVGRVISAFFDSLNIFTIYYFYLLIKNRPKQALFASFVYGLTVLPVQLSHFFAVDTFLNFFLFATFTYLLYWQYQKKYIYLFLASLSYGLAISSKISALYLAPIIFLIYFFHLWKYKKLIYTLISGLVFLLVTFLSIRFFSPYYFSSIFTPNHAFVDSLKSLASFNTQYFPPAVQWLSKTKIIFPLQNLIIWSLGLPICFGLVISLVKKPKILNIPTFLSLVWIFYLFIFQSSQFSYTQRYFLVIVPSIVIIFSVFIQNLPTWFRFVLLGTHLVYLLIFLNVYRLDHSRIQASDWIYQNISTSSTISCEHWDDCLPLPLPNQFSKYSTVTLNLYDPDSPQKQTILLSQLQSIDYIILSSNRLWASIPKVPDLYPQTSLFYQQLFSNQPIFGSNIKFTKVAQFTNYPGIYLPFINQCIYFGPSNYPGVKNNWIDIESGCQNPGVYLRDNTAEEAFSVYDHPQVVVFQKNVN